MTVHKDHLRHWWRVVVVVLGVNALIFSGRYFLGTPQKTQGEKIWESGQYAHIPQSGDVKTIWSAAAALKLGDVDHATELFLAPVYDVVPDRWDAMRKGLFLVGKDDFVGAEQLLAATTHEDPVIRSLVLGMRAYLFCGQKKRTECAILAKDSSQLDPLSAFWLLLQGIAASAAKEYAAAEELFTRAEKLNGVCLVPLCAYYRGVQRFYTGTYTGAVEDLTAVLDNPDRWFEARLFLGRSYMQQKQYTQATEQFTAARNHDWWTDRRSALWLWRVAIAQDDFTNAMDVYQHAYASGVDEIEFLADFMRLIQSVETQEYTWLRQEIIDKIAISLDDLPWNYLAAVRMFTDIWYFAEAEQYLQKWRELVIMLPDELQRDRVMDEFVVEEHHLLVQYMYQMFASGAIASETKLFTGETKEELFWRLDMLGIDPQQVAFLRGLEQILETGTDNSASWLVLIPEIASEDEVFIRFWYVLFRGDSMRALKIATESNAYKKDDPRVLWMKRAVTTRLKQQQLSMRYLNQLQAIGALDGVANTWSLQELWKATFYEFRPWINRLRPYFPAEHWWVQRDASVVDESESL